MVDKTVQEDSAAAATLHAGAAPGASASEIAAFVKKALAMTPFMSSQDVSDLDDVLGQIDGFGDGVPNGAAAQNQATIKAKGAPTYKESLDEIFSGQELSEDFKNGIATVFESAVSLRVAEEIEPLIASIQEAYEVQLAEQFDGIVAKLDEYLDLVAEKWLEDNAVAIESSLRVEMAQELVSKITGVAESYGVMVPENDEELVGALAEENEALEARLNAVMNELLESRSENDELVREKLVAEATVGLAVADAERLKALSETVEFTDANEYSNKLKTLKESGLAAPRVGKTDHEDSFDEDLLKEAVLTAPGDVDPVVAAAVARYKGLFGQN